MSIHYINGALIKSNQLLPQCSRSTILTINYYCVSDVVLLTNLNLARLDFCHNYSGITHTFAFSKAKMSQYS